MAFKSEEQPGEPGLGAEVVGQDFEGGKIASSSHGTYGVPSQIVDLYEDWLGVPISPVETRNAVTLQLFEAGVVYSSDGGGYAVRAEVDEYAQGWFPISAEEDIAAATTAGRAQRFKDASGLEMTVYSARDTGVHGVAGPRLDRREHPVLRDGRRHRAGWQARVLAPPVDPDLDCPRPQRRLGYRVKCQAGRDARRPGGR